jgi:hypothetical protein
MRGELAPRLGDARSGREAGLFGQHGRGLCSGCLELCNPQLQLLDLSRALFTALPKLQLAQLENLQLERFDLNRVGQNLCVFDDDLRVLFLQQRLEFCDGSVRRDR